jgi:hypothetical protein
MAPRIPENIRILFSAGASSPSRATPCHRETPTMTTMMLPRTRTTKTGRRSSESPMTRAPARAREPAAEPIPIYGTRRELRRPSEKAAKP